MKLTAAALAALLCLAACGGSGGDRSARDERERTSEGESERPEEGARETLSADGAAPAEAEAEEEEEAAAPAASEDLQPTLAQGERSGPTRRARCALGSGPDRPCSFTPLFGDGSFHLVTGQREVRLLIEGTMGDAWEVISTERNVPIGQDYVRDPEDRACWITEDANADFERICAR